MSNRRGTRRVFRPPGRFDEDENNDNDHDDGKNDNGAPAPAARPPRASTKAAYKPPDAAVHVLKKSIKKTTPMGTATTDTGSGQDEMDALLSGSVSSLNASLRASTSIAKDELKSMDALLSGATAAVQVERRSSGTASKTEDMAHVGNLSTGNMLTSARRNSGGGGNTIANNSAPDLKYDDTSSQLDSMPIMNKLRKKSKQKALQQATVEAMVSPPEEAQLDMLLAGASPQTALRSKTVTQIVDMEMKQDDLKKEPSAASLAESESGHSSSSRKKKTKKDKKEKKKKKKKLEWSTDVFVVSPPLSPTKNTDSEDADELDVDTVKDLPPLPSTGMSSRNQGLAKRKSVRIDNKQKLNTRWEWAQTLVSTQFMPFKRMLAEGDDLLPNPDEYDSYQDIAENEHFERVRDAMLEADGLNEREIAAFIEGIALFSVKVNSLQSQLDSFKAIQRAEEGENLRRQSIARTAIRSRSIVNTLNAPFPRTHPTSDSAEADAGAKGSSLSSKPVMIKGRSDSHLKMSKSGSDSQLDARPAFLRQTIRAMSIKKIQESTQDDEEVQRLLKELEDAEKKQKKLEKQLQQAGLVIAEDIDFAEAKTNVARIAKRMNEIGSSEVEHEDKAEQTRLRQEYFSLEQDMEKFNTALVLTDEYIEEQEEMEQKWEDDNRADNLQALKKLRRHMPVNVKSLSEAQLCSDETPNGKFLPKATAKKFKRTNVLQLIRSNPEDLTRMHPSTLENLRVTGLTLTERRAIYCHLIDVGPRWKAMQADQMTERKWTWYKMMKTNFKENLNAYQRHVMRYGPPGNHPYATRENPEIGCPLLGKQCPLKADKLIDYDGDYGYTEEAEYEVSNVKKADKEDPGAKAMREAAELTREKKSNERGAALKKHYKGKLLQVSLANGSCETMDTTVDRIEFLKRKWIEERLTLEGGVTDERRRTELAAFSDALNELKLSLLAFAERSGMQLTGRKDVNADQPDIRSSIELGLSEEICETCLDFFEDIDDRMRDIKAKDGRLKSTIDQLRELLDELHERNHATLKELGEERPERSRKLKSSAEITREIKKALREREPPAEEQISRGPPPGAMGGRGSLMDAIAGGRGRGGGGGRGGLMDAIAGRGRGGGGGGRGGLMDAIAGRGRGGGGGGGRGGLMDAIAGRGRGGGGGGGRGGLMDAIAGRGRGGGKAGGGRGDLMSAIAGRGGGGGGGGQGGRGDLMSAIAGRGGAASGGGGRGDLMSAIAGRGRGGGGG